MTKYLINRLIRGVISIIIVVVIVMVLIYTLMDRELIFMADPQFTKKSDNERVSYKYMKWEEYGYLDYVPYSDYLKELRLSGEIEPETQSKALILGKTPSADSEIAQTFVKQFTEKYESLGYTVERHDYVKKSNQKSILLAYKDKPVMNRAWNYFAHLFTVDNIHYVEKTTGTELDNTGIHFTLFDPVYNKDGEHTKFSPAIMGQGTKHKYLLYFDNQAPYIHQNIIKISLGQSYAVQKGIDIYDTLFDRQDPNKPVTSIFPTGVEDSTPRNPHSVTYVKDSLGSLNSKYYNDDYTQEHYFKESKSRTGFSFVIGIISVVASYLLGIPLGIIMARRKDTWIDKIGTIYVIFIIAVPSLAYIFLFRSIGRAAGLPTLFNLSAPTNAMYILPIVSLALPSIAGLMKWIRRYMIDQMNADYVKFARSGGLSESEIFTKHILKNAIIPIVHGIPGSILGSITGAIITERIYGVPGAGNLLTTAINQYDNSVIVGLTMFYAALSVISLILGDILMAIVDPRISFTDKAR